MNTGAANTPKHATVQLTSTSPPRAEKTTAQVLTAHRNAFTQLVSTVDNVVSSFLYGYISFNQSALVSLLDSLTDRNLEETATKLQQHFLQKSAKNNNSQQQQQQEAATTIAMYIVYKKVVPKVTTHKVLLQLLAQLNNPHLDRLVVEWSCKTIRVLLCAVANHLGVPTTTTASPDKVTYTADRPTLETSLKHLGMWIGNFTLGRNKPLLHNSLPLKELLLGVQSFEFLCFTVPFICNILRAGAHSKVL